MNTHLNKSLLILLIGMISFTQNAFSTNNYTWNQASGNIDYLEYDYCNDLDEVYTINTGSNSPVKIDFNVQCEYGYDYLLIYGFDNSDNLVLLRNVSGWETGSVTSFYSGKIKLVFYTDESVSYADESECGDGFSVSFASQSAYTTASTYLFGGNTILPFGNVGIGTTTPATVLNVVGTTDASPTTHGLIVLGATNTSNISIDQNEIMARNNGVVSPLYLNHEGGNIILNGTNATGGNVGLGTMSPGSKLDIVGASNNISLRVTNNTYNDWVLQKRRSDNTQLLGIKETGSNGSMSFVTNNIERMTVAREGNVGIGTSNPDYKLDVNGTIRATEIKIVSPDSFPDYVFDKTHYLPKLNEVRQYIAQNGHLPGIQSAADAKVNGIDLVDMQMKLLKKMEEMTLYILEQQDTIEQLEKKLDAVKTK